MKKTFWGVLGVVVATGLGGMTGCTGPIPASHDPYQLNQQVQVDSYWMASWVRVGDPVPSRVPGGGLEIAMPVRNLNDYDLIVEYTYRFVRKNGTQVEDPGHGTVRLPRKGDAEIKFTSMTPLAEDFRVLLRYRKVEG